MCEIVEDEKEDRRVINIALAGLCNLLNDFSPLRTVMLTWIDDSGPLLTSSPKAILERGMVARIAALSRYPEETLRVNALWAVKNIMNKATADEKESVMSQIGWQYFLE